MPVIDVAAAALLDRAGRVLLALRDAQRDQGNLWEFPGGKCEPGEAPVHALCRELDEELGILPRRFRPLITVEHDYGLKQVRLHVFRVEDWLGTPHGREGQPITWAPISALDTFALPAANLPICRALQWPELMLITPEPEPDAALFLEHLAGGLAALPSGVRAGLQLRAHALRDAEYRQLIEPVRALCEAHHVRLFLNRPSLTSAAPVHPDWHVPSAVLSAETVLPSCFSAAVHNTTELQTACARGASALLISPVQATASHPNTSPLGWHTFSEWARQAARPCYALGGMQIGDLETAWLHGGQGLALMRGWWPVAGKRDAAPLS